MKNGRKDGNAAQEPASFNRAKDVAGFKKGGGVDCYKTGGSVKHDDVAQDKKLISKMIKAEGKKEAGVRYSASDNGAPVKKIPLKLAEGGAAKQRHGFPNTLKPKKK